MIEFQWKGRRKMGITVEKILKIYNIFKNNL